MKKSILLIASVMAAGCSISEFDQQTAIQVKELTITASREGDGPETRTVRNESNGAILWTPGDRISLFYGSGADGGSEFTSQGTTNSKVTNFTGTIGVITGGADVSVQDTYFWGLYPYDESASCDGESITMTLSDYQVATPGTFAPNTFPAIGRSPGLNMPFYNICGGLKIQVQKEGLKKVTLHSNDGPIAGKARIVLDGSGVPSVAEIIDGSEDIVLEAPAGEYLVPGKNYYFVIFPHEFKDNYFTLTFESFTEIGTYERKKPFTITRSIFEGFSVAIDGSVNYERKTGSIPIEDTAFKNWLISNDYDSDLDGDISYAEAEQIKEIWIGECENYNIQSLQGIEYMPNLTHLCCTGSWKDPLYEDLPEHYYIGQRAIIGNHTSGAIGTLKKLDVSYNPKLVLLNVGHNEGLGETVGTLDISNNPELEFIGFSYSSLHFPEISHLTKLKHFETRGCYGEVPDFSGFSTLDYLEIHDPLEDHDFDINVSNCHNLETLIIDNTTGIVSGIAQNTKLKRLDICSWTDYYNKTNADLLRDALPVLTELEWLDCGGLYMGGIIDVSHNSNLKHFTCRENSLTQLNIGNNPEITYLDVAGNRIESLDLNSLLRLEILWADWNPFETIELSSNPELTRLHINGSPISALDLSQNTKLVDLVCRSTNLSSLDLSNNKLLEQLDCRWNNISILDVSKCPHLGESHYNNYEFGETSLYCVQNVGENGVNLLQTLYIAEGQVIPFINDGQRSEEHIPPTTSILVTPNSGENEGSGDHENEP